MEYVNLISYRGIIDYNVIEELLHKYNSNFEINSLNPMVIKRTFSILVESFENCIKHQAVSDTDGEILPISFNLEKSDKGLELSIGNFINSDKIKTLDETIRLLNSYNKKELNAYYRSAMINASISEKGGAGLGLIEIARYTTDKIDLVFSKNNSYVTFKFKIDFKISA